MLRDPLQSSRCPAIPEKSSFRLSQSSRNRDLDICNLDDCDWILNFERSRCNSDGLRSAWIGFVATPIAPGLRFDSSGWGPDSGPLYAIFEMPRNPRLFAILVQSCELWVDCRIKAILTQFRQIATKYLQSAQDCNQTEIRVQSTQTEPGQNQPKRCQF